jgi:Ni,Fe-hydrogenase I large subunit
MNSVILLKILLALSLLIAFLSCSSTKTDIIGEWQPDNYKKGTINNVLIVGIFSKDKPLLRRNFEDGITKAFKNDGINATPSMDHMPYDVTIDSTTFEKYFKELNVDAVVVSRLISVDQKRDYQSGYLYTVPFSYYYGFYSYYYSGIAYANSSGYLSQDVVVVLETNIYDSADKQLIWSGISETMDPDKASDVTYSFGETLVSKLKKEGYFK